MNPETTAADALVINIWGIHAAANGQLAILALCGIILVLILTKRFRWW